MFGTASTKLYCASVSKGHLVVATAPLTIASPHTKSVLKTIVVVELKSILFISKHLPKNFICTPAKTQDQAFPHVSSITLNKLKFHTTN